MFVPYVPYMS